MNTPIEIRPYQDNDLAAVVALWQSLFDYSAPHQMPETAIAQKVAQDDGLFLVAHENDDLLGTVMGGYDGHRGWVYSLAVATSRRRQGIATALMQALQTALYEAGCRKINLQILAGNEDVVAFYETMGFAVEPRFSMGKRLYDVAEDARLKTFD